MTIGKKQTPGHSADAESFVKKTALFLCFGGSGAYLLLSLIYQALIANVGTSSPVVYIFSYAGETLSVCINFCIAAVIIYTFLAKMSYAHHFSILMNILAEIGVTVLLTAGFTWLTALLDDKLRLPFSLGNFTLSSLEDGTQLLMIISMSFISVISAVSMIHVALLIVRLIKRKQSVGKKEPSKEELTDLHNAKSPLAISPTVTAAVFAIIGIAFQVFETIDQVNAFKPRLISEYLELIIPYFLVVVYTLAGYFAMQYFLKYFTGKIAEIK